MIQTKLYEDAPRPVRVAPDHFSAVKEGLRRFDLHKDEGDAPFAPGDVLLLQEWDREKDAATGDEMLVDVLYVCRDVEGLAKGWALMSIWRVGASYS